MTTLFAAKGRKIGKCDECKRLQGNAGRRWELSVLSRNQTAMLLRLNNLRLE